MAELFDVSIKTINEHLTNIFNEGELLRDRTIRKFQVVQLEGVRQVKREPMFYNLDAIIRDKEKTYEESIEKVNLDITCDQACN